MNTSPAHLTSALLDGYKYPQRFEPLDVEEFLVSSMKTLWKMPPPCHCITLALALGSTHSKSPAAEVSADLHWRGKPKLRRKGQPIHISCVQKNPTTLSIVSGVRCLSRVFLWVLHTKTGSCWLEITIQVHRMNCCCLKHKNLLQCYWIRAHDICKQSDFPPSGSYKQMQWDFEEGLWGKEEEHMVDTQFWPQFESPEACTEIWWTSSSFLSLVLNIFIFFAPWGPADLSECWCSAWHTYCPFWEQSRFLGWF